MECRCQRSVSGIFGNVFDETGADLPSIVHVRLTNTETGKSLETTTDKGGFYEFPCPDNGHYDLTFSAEEFTTHAVKDILFRFPDSRRFNQVMYLSWHNHRSPTESTDLLIRVHDSEGRSVEGAVIELDGHKTAKTFPCGVTYVSPSPGKHILGVYKEGYQEATTTLEVRGGYMNVVVTLNHLTEQ